MYISLWENSRGHPDNVSFMQFSTKIDGFEQNDSQGFENSYNSYEQYPLEKFFIFTIYQNYTLALNVLNYFINITHVFLFCTWSRLKEQCVIGWWRVSRIFQEFLKCRCVVLFCTLSVLIYTIFKLLHPLYSLFVISFFCYTKFHHMQYFFC